MKKTATSYRCISALIICFGIAPLMSFAEVITLTSKLDGAAFASVTHNDEPADDYSFVDSAYARGVVLNKGWDWGSPLGEYIFIVPPSSAGTYGTITLAIRGKGSGVLTPKVYVGANKTEISFLQRQEGTYSNTVSSSYIEQQGAYGVFRVYIQAASYCTYDVDFVQLTHSINTQNKWLRQAMAARSFAKQLREQADVVQRFDLVHGSAFSYVFEQDLANALDFSGVMVSYVLNATGLGLVAALYDGIGTLQEVELFRNVLVSGFDYNDAVIRFSMNSDFSASQIATRMRTEASHLETLSDLWLTHGSDGQLSVAQQNAIVQAIDGRRDSLYDRFDSLYLQSANYIRGWAAVYNHPYDSTQVRNLGLNGIRALRPLIHRHIESGATSPDPNKSLLYLYRNAIQEDIVEVEIRPSHSSVSLIVDGTSYVNGGIFRWVKGTTHTIEAPESQGDYFFTGWSDGGARVHQITPTESGTLTASYIYNRAPSVSLIAPANGITLDVLEEFSFEWSGSDPDGDPLTYHVGFAEFESGPFEEESFGQETSFGPLAFQPQPPDFVFPVTLYWRVRVSDPYRSTTSPVRSLTFTQIPPTVELTSPPSGSEFDAGEPITLAASAFDRGGMDRVDFFINGALVGSDNSSPYSIVVPAPSGNQSHSIWAVAYDQAGASTTSEAVTITTRQLDVSTASLPFGMELVPYSANLQADNGTPPYTWSLASGLVESEQANSFEAVGVAQGWHADDQSWAYDLPFEFPFFGNMRTRIWISSNGTITFDGHFTQWWTDFSTFQNREIITPLWRDLATYAPDDIKIQEGADHVTIYFDASYLGGGKVNVSATLHRSGRIELKYGTGNANGGMIGISAGNGADYLLSAKSESGSMNNAADIMFLPVGGLPDGLSLSSDGMISGTPVLAGTYPVTFTVHDDAGDTASKELDIVIEANPNTRPVIESTTPPEGFVTMTENSSQVFSVMAHDPEGEPLTYHWTLNGETVGTDDASFTHFANWGEMGRYNLRCYVSDDLWQNDVFAAWQIDVQAMPIDIITDSLPAGMEMLPYSATLEAVSGVAYSWSVMPQIMAWGGNWSGQSSVPSGLMDITAIAAGSDHSLALKSDGTVVAWGGNWNGQANVPFGLSGVQAIAAGGSHSLALLSDGTVLTWGANWYGQCDVPDGLSGVIAIAAGVNHSLALRFDGTVVAWGAGATDTGDWPHFGQSDVPASLADVIAIEASEYHSLAVRSDGTVVAWGAGGDPDIWSWPHYGQSAVPSDLNNVVALAAGAWNSVALKSDGSLVAWGAIGGNQELPSGLDDIIAISGGGQHYVALREDGTVVAWGENWNGQINVPEEVNDAVDIAAGGSHSLLLRAISTQMPAGLILSADGTIQGTPVMAGTYTPTFVVQNSSGSTASIELDIVIEANPNTRPVIDSATPPEGMVTMEEDSSHAFSVSAHDPEGVPLTYYWTLNGEPVGDGTASYMHSTDWGDAGFHVLRCYVSDDLWDRIVYAQWNINVPVPPPSTLAGRVRGAGLPLEGAYVELRRVDGSVYRRVYTDAAGNYVLDEVRSGYYRMKAGADFYADIWYQNANHLDQADLLTVPAESVIGGLDFDLASGQSPALVEVTSDPAGADIYLDYWPTGEVTPATINVGEVGDWDWAGYRLASHVITLKKAGHPRPSPQTVPAVEAETVAVSFDLTSSATGAVSVVTTPEGAEVYVDYADAAEGVTPIVVGNLAPGSHTILLRKVGYLQPRPIVAWVWEDETTEVAIPLEPDTAESRMMAEVHSVPQGIPIYIDYLPSGQVTDTVVGLMDPVKHAGSGWHSASHTILLRREGMPPMAPRYVPDMADTTHWMMMHLTVDPTGLDDSNGDGIPDWMWEQHGYDPNSPPDVNAIADASGMTYGDKLRAGLIPGDPNSRFEMGGVEMSGDAETGMTITFVFDTVPGRRYVVQAREKLTEGGWTNVSGVITATAYQTVFSAQIPGDTGNQFYRLIVLVP